VCVVVCLVVEGWSNITMNPQINVTGPIPPDQRRQIAQDLVDDIDTELANKQRNRDSRLR